MRHSGTLNWKWQPTGARTECLYYRPQAYGFCPLDYSLLKSVASGQVISALMWELMSLELARSHGLFFQGHLSDGFQLVNRGPEFSVAWLFRSPLHLHQHHPDQKDLMR